MSNLVPIRNPLGYQRYLENHGDHILSEIYGFRLATEEAERAMPEDRIICLSELAAKFDTVADLTDSRWYRGLAKGVRQKLTAVIREEVRAIRKQPIMGAS